MKKSTKKTGPAGKQNPRSAAKMGQTGSGSLQAKFVLRLYVSGSTLKSALAVKNVKHVCEQHLNGRCNLEIIDIFRQAKLARDEQIVKVPTLIKRLPHILRRLIGDLSDQEKVLFGLDLKVRE
jgi:circadian clock protein KaiB